jgi:hypothetical protein
MSKNIEILKNLLISIEDTRSKYNDFAENKISSLFKEEGNRRPPRDFKESSFLYIRSFDGDNGTRPFTNTPFWTSPDIKISPVNDISDYTTNLIAGKTYNINCKLRNKGDLMIPAVKVEFFLCTPSLGMDTRYAQNLGIAQMTEFLMPNATGEVNFRYTVSPTEAGHKCLFARAFSFSPLDIPNDPFLLDPRMDRHTAQLNLDFAMQASSIPFQLIHARNAVENITMRMMTRDEVFATRHPFVNSMKIIDSPKIAEELINNTKLSLKRGNHSQGELSGEKGKFQLISADKGDFVSLKEQQKMASEIKSVLASINKGVPKRKFQSFFERYKAMNEENIATQFQLHLPKLKLKKGECFGFHLVGVNEIWGEKGGITIIVLG